MAEIPRWLKRSALNVQRETAEREDEIARKSARRKRLAVQLPSAAAFWGGTSYLLFLAGNAVYGSLFSSRDVKAEVLYELQNPPRSAVVVLDEREKSIDAVVAETVAEQETEKGIETKIEPPKYDKPAGQKTEKPKEQKSKPQTNIGEQKTKQQTSIKPNSRYGEIIRKWDGWMTYACNKFNVPKAWGYALIDAESDWNWKNSSAGAIGPGQLMPSTARALGVNPHNPEENICGAIKQLRYLLDKYDGNKNLALAAYNAGSGSIKNGKLPNIKETTTHRERFYQRVPYFEAALKDR